MKFFKQINQKFREVLTQGVEQSVVKATANNFSRPKEKHLKTLLEISGGKDGESVEDMIKYLNTRMNSNGSWNVKMKSLIVFHVLIQKGFEDFSLGVVNFQEGGGSIFKFKKNGLSKIESYPLKLFVRNYGKYLDKRLDLYQLTGIHKLKMDLKIEDKYYNNINELLSTLKPIQLLLDSFFDCNIEGHTEDVGIGKDYYDIMYYCFNLLLVDSLVVYKLVNKSMIKLFDLFFKLKPKDSGAEKNAKKSYEMYSLHSTQMNKLLNCYAKLKNSSVFRKYSGINIPKFSRTDDDSLLKSMDDKVQDIVLLKNVEVQDISDFLKMSDKKKPRKKEPEEEEEFIKF